MALSRKTKKAVRVSSTRKNESAEDIERRRFEDKNRQRARRMTQSLNSKLDNRIV